MTINQNTAIFIEDNARENIVCEMAYILSRPQCVNQTTVYGRVWVRNDFPYKAMCAVTYPCAITH